MTTQNEEQVAPALLLVKSKHPTQRPDLLQSLAELEHVMHCEAVDGEFDIIANINPLPQVGLERFIEKKVSVIPAVERVSLIRVDTLPTDLKNPDTQNAAEVVALVEIEPARFEPVFQAVSLLSATSLCQIADSRDMLVVRLRGTNFGFIERVVEEKIRPLQGVLRTRAHQVIKLSGF